MPDPTTADFLICDGVRAEQGGKWTLLGFFGGESVNINPPATLPNNVPLAFVFILRGGQGKFDSQFTITDPDGNLMQGSDTLPPIEKHEGRNHLLALNFPIFPLPKTGVFKIKLTVGSAVFEKEFEVTNVQV